MYKIAICDDDIKDLDSIYEMLKNICSDVSQDIKISAHKSPDEILNASGKIDIAILDVDLPGLSGIELGMKLKEKHPKISLIYTSGYEDYCKQVINKVHAFSFLIKPVDMEELKNQICECLKGTESIKRENLILFENIKNSKGEELASIRLNAEDILYCECMKMQREVAVVLKDRTYYIKEVIEKLTDKLKPYGFVVNRRGSIINLRHIKKLKGYTIYMDNGKELALTQKRVADFKESMSHYIHKDE